MSRFCQIECTNGGDGNEWAETREFAYAAESDGVRCALNRYRREQVDKINNRKDIKACGDNGACGDYWAA